MPDGQSARPRERWEVMRDLARLTWRYTFALALLAVLTLAGQALVQQALTAHARDAGIINVAGRQRMLSQRLTKAALALAAASDGGARQAFRTELTSTVAEWARSHRGLAQGEGWAERRPLPSATVTSMYARLETTFAQMLRSAQAFIQQERAGEGVLLRAELERLLAVEPVFLSGMDDIVYQFQREADARVANVRRVEMALAGLILLTLVLEGLFVFKPAVARIRRTLTDLDDAWARLRSNEAARVRDLTERQRLEREILEISERERERIGQDIHDGLCQQLAGIRFVTESLVTRAERGGPVETGELRTLADLGRRAMSVASGVARGLALTSVSDEGLASALTELAAEASAQHGISCAHDIRMTDDQIPRDVALQLYRIAQEAVNNAVKHGAPRNVHVALQADAGDVVMSVADDGVGIPDPGVRHNGMGLHIMRNRARTIGATLEIERAGGTRISCRVPAGGLEQP